MSDDKKARATALGAAISMLGLSLGVASPAEAQQAPGTSPRVTPQAGGTQGVLIALDQPGSQQWKSQQYKSEQLKSQQLKSQQVKLQSQQVKLAPQH
jgi:hypothetical protein